MFVCRHDKVMHHILHKNSSKRKVVKENYHSNKPLNYLLVVFTKFLHWINQVYEKSYSQHGTQFFYLFEKARYFCGKKVLTEEFWHEF